MLFGDDLPNRINPTAQCPKRSFFYGKLKAAKVLHSQTLQREFV
jgi:hypothetical protein